MQKVFNHDLNINGIHLKSKIMSIFKSCTYLHTMSNTLTTSNSCSFHIANVISTKYHNQHDTKTEEKDLKYFYHESIVLLIFVHLENQESISTAFLTTNTKFLALL